MATKTTVTLQELEKEIGMENMARFLKDLHKILNVEKIRITIPSWESLSKAVGKDEIRKNIMCILVLIRVLSNDKSELKREELREIYIFDFIKIIKPLLDKFNSKRLVINYRKLKRQDTYQKVINMERTDKRRKDISKETGLSQNYITKIVNRYGRERK
ncbi:MAG: hypothetical protein Q4F79_12765 [Eubacteriales bacterium]|nr:hypothetical protein [Eubacteriales bacterium]